jgi:hypothetical protein
MGIEQDAAKDLSLTEDDAEMVAGGKKTKKPAAHKTAAKTYAVGYVNAPASASTAPPDSSGTTAWTDDCDDPASV